MDPKTTLFRRPLSRDWLVWALLLVPVTGGWRIGVHALHDTGSWFGGRPTASTRFLVVAAALVVVVLAVAWLRRVFVAGIVALLQRPPQPR